MGNIPKIKKKAVPLNERAYRMLKDLILKNSLEPGEWLVESKLAKALGISRSPVREALVKLENERLVEVVPSQGIRVMPLSAKYFNEVYEIREAMEGLAARKVAPLITDQDLDKLASIIEEMQNYLDREDYEAWSKKDTDVHNIFVSKVDNDMLKEAIRKLRDHFSRTIDFGSHFPKHLEKAQEEHRVIWRVMKTRSPEKLEQAVRTHVENVRQRLVEAFNTFRKNSDENI